jgi:hypothetical protein
MLLVALGLGVRGEGVGAVGGRAPRELKDGEGMPGEAARGAAMEGGTAEGLAPMDERARAEAEEGMGVEEGTEAKEGAVTLQVGGHEETACEIRCRGGNKSAASTRECP